MSSNHCNGDDPLPSAAGAETAAAAPADFAQRVDETIALLESIRDDNRRLAELQPETRTRLLMAAGMVARPGPWAKRELARAVRRRRRAEHKAADDSQLAQTGIRVKRLDAVLQTPSLKSAPVAAGAELPEATTRRLHEPRTCYVCKADFSELHFFYDSMCASCAELNWHKRHQTADLSGRVALVTGSRVKIGYQTGIFLLRAGAHLIVTTRFPRDAALRYAREEDFADWGHRLQIHGLDLRHTPSVDAFTRHLNASLDGLDFIINNACQTVRRPVGFYQHLMDNERVTLAALPKPARRLLEAHESTTALAAQAAPAELRGSAALSQVELIDEDFARGGHIFPAGKLDADLQQVDLRSRNSWRLALDEVPAVELLEVQLVNAVAPFILNARLKPLMMRNPSADKHIVNVSAMEGQFYRRFKTDKHPHTNMAKAALNMLTRTSAADYVKDGIHMNSVDTGWVTDEDPVEIAVRKTAEHGFHPPLDIVDGAARICDPIFSGIATGEHRWGLFFKDYAPTDW